MCPCTYEYMYVYSHVYVHLYVTECICSCECIHTSTRACMYTYERPPRPTRPAERARGRGRAHPSAALGSRFNCSHSRPFQSPLPLCPRSELSRESVSPPPFANPTPNPSRFSNRLAFAPGGESVLPRMRYFLTSSLPILQVLLRQSFKISTGGLWSGFFRPNLLNNPSSNHFTL